MNENGFYIISDQFFIDFPDPYLKGNKEENRPHYFAIKDQTTGLYWMIPMSTKVSKHRAKMKRRETDGKPNDILHIAKCDGKKESVFLIQDIFPVSEKYIRREYVINNIPLILKDKETIDAVKKKAKRIMQMKRRGIKLLPTQADVIYIERELSKEFTVV